MFKTQTQTKTILAKTSLTFIFLLLFLPVFVNGAASAKTAANQTGITYECGNNIPGDTTALGNTAGNCDFYDLIAAIQKLTTWGRNFALAFSVIVIAVAGFRYMVSGDNASERKKANNMMIKVAIGMFFMLCAWLIVTLITTGLGVTVSTYLY